MKRKSSKKRMVRSVLCLVLSLLLAASILPADSLAEETTEDTVSVEEAAEDAVSVEETAEDTESAEDTEEDTLSEDETEASGSGSVQTIEEEMDSWRYSDGEVISNPDTDNAPDTIRTLSSIYSTWKKSYGTSYFGIVSGSTTTKVAVDGVVRVGIDVSHHQGTIDWETVAASGVDFAIIRCGYGSDYESQDDSEFLNNVKGALENGIEIGIYLYSYATSTSGSNGSASSEAEHVLRLLEEAGLDPDDLDLPVFLDLEDSTQTSLGASALGDIAETFCDALEEEGYAVGIYASKYWWETYLTDSRFTDEGWYKWVARYPTSTSTTSSGVDDTDLWQFTSNGTVSGISGSVDVNFEYNGEGFYDWMPAKAAFTSVSVNSDYTSVTLKWSALDGADGYQIYRKTGSGSYTKVADLSGSSVVSYTDTGLSAGTTYSYKIRGYRINADGEYVYGYFSSAKSVTTNPSAPTLSSVTLSSSLVKATVKWKSVSNADGYEIYRKTGSGSYSKVKTITDSSTVSWTNSSLSLGKTYTYKIRAYKTLSDGTKVYSSYSGTKSVTTRPSKVTISSASTTSSGYIKVTWKKVSNATGYVIYRSVNGGSYSKVKTITSNSTVSWTNQSVSAGKVYRYKIRAYTKSGSTTVYSSSYSSVKKVTAKPAKVTITSIKSTKSRSGTIKWKKVSGATGYQVAYRRKGSSTWSYCTVKTNSKTLTLLRKKNYYVKVRAYKTYNGKKYYGPWSSQKAMTVK